MPQRKKNGKKATEEKRIKKISINEKHIRYKVNACEKISTDEKEVWAMWKNIFNLREKSFESWGSNFDRRDKRFVRQEKINKSRRHKPTKTWQTDKTHEI